jgi:hypothetical protein
VARRFADFADLREALLLPDVVPDLTARNTIMSTPFPPKTGLLESKIDQPLLQQRKKMLGGWVKSVARWANRGAVSRSPGR